MKALLVKIMTGIGMGLCSLAVMIVPVAASACRYIWYEPEVPENLDRLITKTKKVNDLV